MIHLIQLVYKFMLLTPHQTTPSVFNAQVTVITALSMKLPSKHIVYQTHAKMDITHQVEAV